MRKMITRLFLLFTLLFATAITPAWAGIGFGFGFGGPVFGLQGYGHGRYGYGYGYGFAPNVVINVPVVRHRQPYCEEVEVCNQYDECWLERYCN